MLTSQENTDLERAHVVAGDSHTMALTEQGFIYGWGTFRNSSGVFSFSPQERLALLPCLVHSPTTPASQAVKIVSGKHGLQTRIQVIGCEIQKPSCHRTL